MITLFWIGVAVILAGLIFGLGFLFAVREMGKDVKFYKDCVRVLRGENVKQELKYQENRGKVLIDAPFILWLNRQIAAKDESISMTHSSTLANSFECGERSGYLSVLQHLQGFL